MRKQNGKVQDLKFKELFCSQCISVDTNITQAAISSPRCNSKNNLALL